MTPRIRRTISSFVALLLLGSSAFADPIVMPFFEGEIAFAGIDGSATPTGGTGLGDATSVDFNSAAGIYVFGTSGDFTAIPILTPATFFDFVFAPSAPADPLWQITLGDTVYQFVVEMFTVVTQTSNILAIEGTGYLSATDFSDTSGTWAFSLDQSGSTVFGWSSTTAVVPEPGSLALLGIGLMGLGLTRRRRLQLQS